jgi:hypothetical protein
MLISFSPVCFLLSENPVDREDGYSTARDRTSNDERHIRDA